MASTKNLFREKPVGKYDCVKYTGGLREKNTRQGRRGHSQTRNNEEQDKAKGRKMTAKAKESFSYSD